MEINGIIIAVYSYTNTFTKLMIRETNKEIQLRNKDFSLSFKFEEEPRSAWEKIKKNDYGLYLIDGVCDISIENPNTTLSQGHYIEPNGARSSRGVKLSMKIKDLYPSSKIVVSVRNQNFLMKYWVHLILPIWNIQPKNLAEAICKLYNI